MCNVSMHYINKNDNTRLINNTISILPAMKAAMNPQSNKHFFAFFILVVSVSSSLSAETTKNVCNKAGNSVKSPSERLLNELVESSKTQKYLTKSLDINGSSAVYGMLQCRGDASQQDCQECSQRARRSLNESCSSGTGSTIWLDLCYLRWGTAKFSGVLDLKGRLISTPKDVPQMASNFRDSAVKLLNDLTSQVMSSFDERRYASRNISQGASPSGSIYGFVQCWNDISKPDCGTCLGNATRTYNTSYIGSPSVRVLKRSCMVMYDPHLFYKNLGGEAVPNTGIEDKTTSGDSNSKSKLAIILGSVGGSVLLLLLLFSSCYFAIRRKRQAFQTEAGNAITRQSSFPNDDQQIFYNIGTIMAATSNFSDDCKIGEGGFGVVYKGELPNGKEVAVKKLSLRSSQGKKEFLNEIRLVARVQHRNLVNLLGCCTDGSERILVYDYLKNKSLDKFLFDSENATLLDWQKRVNIILGVARGLVYLHEDSKLRIIHRDIKASNILLDDKFNAKIADFGLAKLFLEDQSRIQTGVAGTYGYMAPEYVMHGQLSTKADVYSFGVCLLEIISGRKNSDFISENVQTFLGWAWSLYREGNFIGIVDETLKASCNYEQVVRCIHVGFLCTQGDPSLRLPMSEMASPTMELSSAPSIKEGTGKKKKTSRCHFKWLDPQDEILVQALLDEILEMGKRGDNGMKNDFKRHVTNRVKPLLEGVDNNNVHNRMRTLKLHYQLARHAISQSGFNFTEDGRVIADDAVWGPYIEAHPKAKILRTIRIPHYDKLAKIFGNDTATGEMCMEGNDEDVTRNTEPIDLCDENPGDDTQGDVCIDLESTHGPSASTAHTKPSISGKRRRSLTGLDQFDESCDKIASVATDIASSLKVVNRLPDVMIALMKIPELTDEERMIVLDIMGRQIGLVDIFFALEERMRLPWILRQLAHLG